MTIDAQRLYGLVEQLLAAHAPSGAESAMDALVTELAAPIGDAVWQDAADNIIIHIKGQSRDQPVAAVAHKDEIALIVKRIESDGKIRIQPLGGLHPWALGESPVEILARGRPLPGRALHRCQTRLHRKSSRATQRRSTHQVGTDVD